MSESNIFGISIRAILVLILLIIFCVCLIVDIKNETLNSLVVASIGWYFGQKSSTTMTNTSPNSTTTVTSTSKDNPEVPQ